MDHKIYIKKSFKYDSQQLSLNNLSVVGKILKALILIPLQMVRNKRVI